jgi:hypothetical protein
VAIDDLYAVAKPAPAGVGRPNDVHFTPAGYDPPADAVVASITGQLPEPNEHRIVTMREVAVRYT